MHTGCSASRWIAYGLFAGLLAGAGDLLPPGPAPAHATPPPWAPAHGYRNKQKEALQQDSTVVREETIVIPSSTATGLDAGRCNRETIGALLGGAVGGVLGSTIGKGDGKTVATIGGTLIGVFVGQAIGRHLDQTDRACVDRTLEYAPNLQTITWSNPDTSIDYWVTPERTYMESGLQCRDYTTESLFQGSFKRVAGTACRADNGRWLAR